MRYLDYSREAAEAFFFEGVTFGEEEGIMLAQLSELVCPEGVLFLVRDCNGDMDVGLILLVFDELAVDELLVVDFRQLLVLGSRDRFLLARTHFKLYLSTHHIIH